MFVVGGGGRAGTVPRPANGVRLNTFMELGPACADPIIGGVRCRKAASYEPVYEIDHLRLDPAARLRSTQSVPCPRGNFSSPMPGYFVLSESPLSKTQPQKSPLKTGFRAHPCFLRGAGRSFQRLGRSLDLEISAWSSFRSWQR